MNGRQGIGSTGWRRFFRAARRVWPPILVTTPPPSGPRGQPPLAAAVRPLPRGDRPPLPPLGIWRSVAAKGLFHKLLGANELGRAESRRDRPPLPSHSKVAVCRALCPEERMLPPRPLRPALGRMRSQTSSLRFPRAAGTGADSGSFPPVGDARILTSRGLRTRGRLLSVPPATSMAPDSGSLACSRAADPPSTSSLEGSGVKAPLPLRERTG